MCGEPAEDVDFENRREVTARKPHACYGCHETIRIGDRYRRTVQCVDGAVSTYHHCLRCWRMLDALWAVTDGEPVRWDLNCGEVWENPPAEVAALAFMLPDEAQGRAA